MFNLSRKGHTTTSLLGTMISVSLLAGCATQQNPNQQWPGQQPSYPTYPSQPTLPTYPSQPSPSSSQIIYNDRGVPSHYKVKDGDTVANIANHYGISYTQIARLNNLDNNYTIYKGQWLRLWDTRAMGNTGYPNNNGAYNPNNSPNQILNTAYQYPTTNAIIHHFDSNAGYYGMWFTGSEGDPILASLGGEVLYSGNGLPEYGNLVMIRHDNSNVTAYAHNKELLVREGDKVRTGQRIATMGRTGNTNQVALEFQFRHNGSPIDPRNVLNRPLN